MNTMRKAIVYDRANAKVVRDTSRAIIWDGVVQMSHTVAKSAPVSREHPNPRYEKLTTLE